ncbi:p23 chaperone protein wos2 [Didymosphaeria variabile]|uniref:P23 chaperone protein wos2 n=1 Tax=Didymosphaeria variabile TaxID=1932322 RepID=A0A9W8XMU4_9PLEO|nr:p23 chaperone protein wos2 [Didymosphaeria variabile]KAJ4354454.1 p23 chaperone protein wos2 [Didymosphaeria variabile]
MSTVTPEVTWAQRSSSSEPEKNYIFLTIVATDVPESDKQLDLQPTKLTFKGTSTSKKVTYALELEFFAEIDPKESKIHHTGRDIELVLRKKELKEEFWPRLLKDNKKMHFLKTNFDKWVDEDEQDEAPDDEDYMSKMNPMGAGGEGGFGGIDFSKLGAAQAAGGLPGMEGLEGEGESSDDEEEDDDMPALESDDKPEASSSSSKKIEEVS